jgi:hypothetical protein
VHRHLLPLAALLALAACNHPVDAAVQFEDALANDNGPKAFGLLSTRAQAELTRIAKATHEASGGTVSDDPTLMIVRGDRSVYPSTTAASPHVARASLLSMDGNRAKVTVDIAGTKHEMDLVREGGRWKVDLPLGSP